MIKILIADDQELIRDSLRIVLSGNPDFSVNTAANGIEVVRAVRRDKPDVILMDIRMPILDGYEATRAITALERADSNLPIIAMTADAFSDDAQRCLECGMVAHIAKPIDVKECMRILNKYLGNKNDEGENE